MNYIINLNNKFRIIGIMILVLISFEGKAQTAATEFGKIAISIYIQDSVKISLESKSLLVGKIRQMVKQNGLNISTNGSRFIISASVKIISKEFVESPLPISNIQVSVKLVFGDAQTKKAFSQTMLNLKGKGDSEKRSFIDAFKGINPKVKENVTFVEEGKNEIIKYYSSNCNSILKESNKLADLNNFNKAINLLSSIPENCQVCYFKSLDSMITIYHKKIDFDCKNKLEEAKIIWSYSQTEIVANKVFEILKSSNPLSSYQSELIALFDKIELKLTPSEKINWKTKTKSYKENIVLQKENLKKLEIPTNSPKDSTIKQEQTSRNQELDNFWIDKLVETINSSISLSQRNSDYKSIVWE